jgi:uncharacterized protein (DUF1800 family)
MGMNLMYPPDVSGWDGGPAWVSTGTMVERIKWGSIIFDEAEIGLKNRRFTVGTNSWPLFAQDPTPQGVVRRIVSVFDADMPSSKLPKLVEAARVASGGRISPENSNPTAAAVARLVFASPEFQFA